MESILGPKTVVNTRGFVAIDRDGLDVLVCPGAVLVPDCTTLVYEASKGYMLATIFVAIDPLTGGRLRLWTHGRLAERQVTH